MKKQNFKSDARFYEKQLSPFGNQVLKELIKTWNTDRDYDNALRRCGRRYHQLAARNEGSLDLPATRNKISPSPTTTSQPPSESQFVVSRLQAPSTMSQHDVDGGSESHHLSNQCLPRDYTSYEAFEGIPLSESHLTSKASSNDLIIDWNDMFDEELLIDNHQPPPSPLHLPSSVPLELPAPLTSITFNKDAMCLGASTESNVSEIVCKETINTATKNSSKSKSVQPKIDAAMKKIKRTKLDPLDKCLQRKQKYTMSVKNWLAHIASTRPLEEKDAEAVGGSARGFATQNAVKVIQSRLANKGGVMKFGIPKNVGTSRATKRNKERLPRKQAPAATV